MNLYYAKPSPFARRVRVLLRKRGLLSRVEEIAIAPWESPGELLTTSPASKVPALVLDDGTTLTESALIAKRDRSLPGGAGDGHWLMEEAPVPTIAAVKDFLEH